MKPIFSRLPSLPLRLFVLLLIAPALIIADSHFAFFAKVRGYLDTAVSPFYFLANTPKDILDSASENLTTRTALIEENRRLNELLLRQKSDLQLLGQFKQENNRLRQLLGSPLRKDEQKMVTQVLAAETDPYSNLIIIDKGTDQNVFEGQPVISDQGVVGQVIGVNKYSSRVLLICDSSHAIPIQVLRNDIRVIASGNGCNEMLELEQLPRNIDIRVGDVLVTSGLGGRFPEGYPVAIVSSVGIDRSNAYAVVKAKPTAELQRLRYLLLLWGNDAPRNTPLSPSEVEQATSERFTHNTKVISNLEEMNHSVDIQ
ncbi:rod shape-determining protein MreC [Thorsellia anophelis]|uniref:Cell shape-determining protein MreC n=1 Tax=Thorsellia anophelis DSM 18579 TaxID=1123402 RepID=A0A1I0EGP5_9GAMM|nr:rod shape-determining protein MreC [Thorsellia anophelis DSM 18579]